MSSEMHEIEVQTILENKEGTVNECLHKTEHGYVENEFSIIAKLLQQISPFGNAVAIANLQDAIADARRHSLAMASAIADLLKQDRRNVNGS